MPQVTDCRFLTAPTATISGQTGGVYRATYRCQTNGLLSGLGVLVSGQQAGPDPLPAYGDRYILNIAGSTEADFTSFAREFDARPETDDRRTNWLVSVTWRPLDNFASGGNAGGLQNAVFPTDLQRQPLNWQVRDWMEYESTFQQIVVGRNQQRFRARNAFPVVPVQITNSAHTAVPAEVEGIRRIYVVQRNVTDWRIADEFNRQFNLTTNQTTWRGFAPGSAAYLRSETSPPQYHNDQTYYVMQSRWNINDNGHFHRVRNVGVTAFLSPRGIGDTRGVRLTQDSFPIDEPAELDREGRFAENLEAPNPVPKEASLPLPFIDWEYLGRANYAAIIA